MILVDERWSGNSGIGRYSREILGRIVVPHKKAALSGRPASSWDVLNRAKLSLRSSDTIYTPGYNAGLTRARQIITLHDLIHLTPGHQTPMKSLYYEGVVRRAVGNAGVVMTVSTTSKVAVSEWLRDDSVDVVNTGNGCTSTFIAADPSNREANECHYFLYVGNNKPHKNVPMILAALQLNRSLRLKVVSTDSSEILKLAQQLGVSEQMAVMSNVSDTQLLSLYENATATLLPSSVEGFGLPAAESIAVGTPVIYWRRCHSVAEICEDHGQAVENVNTPLELAELMTDMTQAPTMVVRASADWRRRYSWDGVARIVNETLRRGALR